MKMPDYEHDRELEEAMAKKQVEINQEIRKKKAKDTVLTTEQIKTIWHNWKVPGSEGGLTFDEWLCLAQAEATWPIAFEAGKAEQAAHLPGVEGSNGAVFEAAPGQLPRYEAFEAGKENSMATETGGSVGSKARHWDETKDAQRIERLRSAIQELQRQVNQIGEMVSRLAKHRHLSDGRPCVEVEPNQENLFKYLGPKVSNLD